MKYLTTLIISLLCTQSFSQESYRVEWDLPENIKISNGFIDKNYNTIVTGGLEKEYSEDYEAFIFKIDTLGNYIFNTMSQNSEDTSLYFKAGLQLENNHYFIVGEVGPTCLDSSNVQTKIVSCIYDENLELIFRKKFSYSNTYKYNDYYKILEEDDGNLLVVTTAKRRTGDPINIYDLGIFRFAPNGDTLETKFYHFQRNVSVYDFDKIPCSNNYMVLEFITQLWGEFECLILKPNLEIETINYFSSNNYSVNNDDITCDYWYPDNTFMMASSASMDRGKSDFGLGVFRCDTLANISDFLMLNKPGIYDRNAYDNCMAFADIQSIYVAGYEADFWNCENPDSIELYVVDTSLNQIAYKSLGGDISYDAYGVLTGKNGNAVIYGKAWHQNGADCNSNLVVFHVNRKDIGLPPVKIFNSEPSKNATIAYPNPASNIVNIRTNKELLSKNSRIRLFNAAGKKIYDYKLSEKGNTIQLDITNLEKGTYLYSITSPNIIISNGKFIKQ